MAGRRRHPFTAIDATILGAFATLGIGAAVAADRIFLGNLHVYATRLILWPALPDWLRDLGLPCKRVEEDFRAFLAVASLGIALATFRRGWRSRRGLPAPGVAASACVAGVVLFHLGRAAVRIWWRGAWESPESWVWIGNIYTHADRSWSPFSDVTGAAAGVWSYLLLARQWRPRPEWRDWLGRWLGAMWLADAAIRAALVAIWG